MMVGCRKGLENARVDECRMPYTLSEIQLHEAELGDKNLIYISRVPVLGSCHEL